MCVCTSIAQSAISLLATDDDDDSRAAPRESARASGRICAEVSAE
jgi:hypothetical protein